ncbi:uncharacterized protein BO97DRAFT_23982 [Aspergillus homomorphus CBS 101889]|uniref:Uncharacterized protein n=1 Tax=Aspergillus homomorphus (strain CBS 101889) TaxID=1450537 RepID=A0A395HFR9_ASPHC|nr:hypothetical protein BO97DRAFT_23982 [Aspergillus homomorphus CBS 101889]RAL06580.1 hypothetical protein BO97DRAFT_23982 [Aspergillus homomorphus CBS 101889]
MGLAESRMIVVKLESACIEAECRGHREIKNLLSDNEFIKNLSNIWRDIPAVSKRQIQERRKNRKKKAPQDRKLIDLEALSLQIPQWRTNMRSFFSTEKTLDLELNYPIAETYTFLLQLEARGERDTWRLRLLKVVFHYLLKKCTSYGLE